MFCYTDECWRRAKWEAGVTLGGDGGKAPTLLNTHRYFCPRCRIDVKAEDLVDAGQRKAVDKRFISRRLAPPDWSKIRLHWTKLGSAGPVRKHV